MKIRQAAKDRGILASELVAWEHGQDICPHEKFEKVIGGVHKPFLVLEVCVKCHHTNILGNVLELGTDNPLVIEAFETTKKKMKNHHV